MSKTVTVPEATRLLGVSRAVIIDLIQQGRLPVLKLGGDERVHFRVRTRDLDRLFKPQVEGEKVPA